MNKSKIKIGIVGYGYVGKAFEAFFKDHYDVFIYDPMVCVPTPSNPDGSCDISIVKDCISK